MQPFLTTIIDYISALPNSAKFALLVFTTVLEYIFPIFPGDTIVLFAGFLAAQAAIDMVQVFCAICLGSIIGGWLTFAFGRYLSATHANRAWAAKILPMDKMAVFQKWYQKWGYSFLLISRFMPGIRSFFFIAAGFSRLFLPLVLLLGTLSSLLFNACLLYVGHLVGKNAGAFSQYWQSYSLVINLLILIVVGTVVFFFFKNRSKP